MVNLKWWTHCQRCQFVLELSVARLLALRFEKRGNVVSELHDIRNDLEDSVSDYYVRTPKDLVSTFFPLAFGLHTTKLDPWFWVRRMQVAGYLGLLYWLFVLVSLLCVSVFTLFKINWKVCQQINKHLLKQFKTLLHIYEKSVNIQARGSWGF